MVVAEKQYWEDLTWARTHHTELLAQYQDEWVAIYDQQVVAHGSSGARVEKLAKKKLGKKHFPIYFVDSVSNIYAGQPFLH